MRIAIVGPGAMGCVIGAALLRAGHAVTFFGRASPRLDVLRRDGLRLTHRDGTIEHLPIAATDDPAIVSEADLAIVLVKSGDTERAARSIAPFVRDGQIILTLQNGLGNADRIRAEIGAELPVLSGVTSQGATRIGPGRVIHAGEGPTVVGFDRAADAAAARQVAALLSATGIPTAAVNEIAPWLWRKLAINAAINGLTALAGVPNGMIAADPAMLDAAEIIAEEASAVARAAGWELGSLREAIRETAEATASNRSSMLQDFDAGRPTEVQAIHQEILNAAADAGVATPATTVLTAVIRARERSRATEGSDHE